MSFVAQLHRFRQRANANLGTCKINEHSKRLVRRLANVTCPLDGLRVFFMPAVRHVDAQHINTQLR
jgi:hypothetical protein